MNTAELVVALSKHCDITKTEAKKIVAHFFDSMKQSLAKNDRIQIRELCAFRVKNYKHYVGRNPKTGARVTIKPKNLPVFKMGTDLNKRMNG